MSDTAWVAFINGLFSLLTIIMTAIMVAISRWLNSRETAVIASKVDTAVVDIRKIELATNSMKDALVMATEKEAHARGIKEEKERKTL